MATPIYYRHDDASAPTLTGQAGSLIALLDAILVDGYGSKAAAGWTKPFSGTNKAAYRNSASGTGTYLRVVDDNARIGTTAAVELWGFNTMSDVDTGTDQFPTAANISGDNEQRKLIHKSVSTDSTAREWVALATDKTLILAIDQAGAGDIFSGYVYFIGDYISLVPSDMTNFALLACNFNGDTTPSSFDAILEPFEIDINFSNEGDSRTHYGSLKKSASSTASVGANAQIVAFPFSGNGQPFQSGNEDFGDYPRDPYGLPLSECFIADYELGQLRGKLPSMLCISADVNGASSTLTTFGDVVVSDPTEGNVDVVICPHSERYDYPFQTQTGAYALEINASDWP